MQVDVQSSERDFAASDGKVNIAYDLESGDSGEIQVNGRVFYCKDGGLCLTKTVAAQLSVRAGGPLPATNSESSTLVTLAVELPVPPESQALSASLP